jgi:SAM-dependent methyltransferase
VRIGPACRGKSLAEARPKLATTGGARGRTLTVETCSSSCQPVAVSDNSPERWDAVYADPDDPAPWVIEEAQPEVVALLGRGLLTGRLLDSGCGTGEHSLLARQHGAEVTGVDISRNAVEIARGKARERGIDIHFQVVNMLEPVHFDDAVFDTVLDSGVFHSFEADEQRAYVANLTRVTKPDGLMHLICFSDLQPGDRRDRACDLPHQRVPGHDGGQGLESTPPTPAVSFERVLWGRMRRRDAYVRRPADRASAPHADHVKIKLLGFRVNRMISRNEWGM